MKTKLLTYGLKYGIALGLINSLIIYVTNIVIADNNPDNGGLTVLWLVIMTAVFYLVGYRTTSSGASVKTSASAAALAAFITLSLSLLAFGIIDNLFLDIVGQQYDKLTALKASGSTDMRAFINDNLIRGYLISAPFVIIGGYLAGTFGSGLSVKRKRT